MEGTQEQKENNTDRLRPWQFKPGQSGNPGGRPKGSKSLKAYAKEMLEKMTEEERQEFLMGIDKDKIWEMAEGKPQTDITSGGEKLFPTPILGGITNEIHSNDSVKEDSGTKEAS